MQVPGDEGNIFFDFFLSQDFYHKWSFKVKCLQLCLVMNKPMKT